ncbi:MAG: GNAT family N-acetyltransferase [bacterium]
MAVKSETLSNLHFEPLTPERWPDFENLFGARGACGGCWCMWYRLKRSEFERNKGDGNKHAIKARVDAGTVPGLLAYCGDRAVAWCSVAPREEFPVLQRSHILKPVDDRPVWSIVCFFVTKDLRRCGLTRALLEAVIDYVKERGATILEGYPVAPKTDGYPVVFACTGFQSAFEKAGFVECARRSETRPVMRYYIEPQE